MRNTHRDRMIALADGRCRDLPACGPVLRRLALAALAALAALLFILPAQAEEAVELVEDPGY